MRIKQLRDWTKRWSLQTRLLGIVLLTESLGFVVVAYISARDVAVAWTTGILAGLFLATVALLAMEIRSTAQRLVRMTDRVQKQVDTRDLGGLLPVHRQDEIGRLAKTFNHLLLANKEALAYMNTRADNLATLNMLAATISQTLDMQQVLDISLQQALGAIGWDAGSIYLWDERTKTFNMVSFFNLPEDYIRETISFSMGEGPIGRAAERRGMVITEGEADDVRASSGLAVQLSMPLRVPGSLLGVLNLGSARWSRPDEAQAELLTTIGYQIAVALEKAKLYYDLEIHAEELEGIVAARTEALAQAIDDLSHALERAKEADKVKSQLLSTVSHELRTPLATIKGYTSLLVDSYERMTPEELRGSFIDIEEESDKLTELISNLLEMSRIEAGVLLIQPQEVDLLDVVRSTVEAAQVRVTDHPITFEAPPGRLRATADARRVQQILDNLVDNAAKYSENGKPIVVRVDAGDDESVVSVKDEGHGIPPDRLERIFERFYRIGSDTDRAHGIGLGLAICHGLVEAHGGRIWVESKPGAGSTFSFSLPSHHPSFHQHAQKELALERDPS